MDFISQRKKKPSFVNDKTLWANALMGKHGFDELLGNFDHQNRDEFITTKMSVDGMTNAQAEGYWYGKEWYVNKRIYEDGRTPAQADNDWTGLYPAFGAGAMIAPPTINTNYGNNFWGYANFENRQIANDQHIQDWLATHPHYHLTGFIGSPTNPFYRRRAPRAPAGGGAGGGGGGGGGA